MALLPVHAAQATDAAGEWLGRRNPYRPLIAPKRQALPLPALPDPGLPEPGLPDDPGVRPEARQTPAPARLSYVGLVYDDSEAIAAVSDGRRTRFVRKGDRLDEGTVSSITPQHLTLTRKGRVTLIPLRREGVH